MARSSKQRILTGLLIAAILALAFFGYQAYRIAPVYLLLAAIKGEYKPHPDGYPLSEQVKNAGLGNVAAAKILPLLDDPDPGIRRHSAEVLVSIGADSSLIIPKLLDKRSDADLSVRCAVLRALGAVKPAENVVIEALLEATKDPGTRIAAIQALGRARPTNHQVIDVLVEAGRDEDADVRLAAISSFYSMGPIAKKAVPILTEALSNPKAKDAALNALGNIGPDAKAAVLKIRKFATDDNSYDRIQALRVLRKIEGDTDFVISQLIDLLKGSDIYGRRQAALTLEHMGPPAKAAIPALQYILDHPPEKGPDPNTGPVPYPGVIREMTEEEAYPDLCEGVIRALEKISGK